MIEVPAATIDINDAKQFQGRVLELPRYASLARSVFGEMCDHVYVVETDDTGTKCQFAVKISSKDLDEYIEERAGLVDLVNDSNWTLEGQSLSIGIDFQQVQKAEQTSAKSPFPRKPRTP
jgi:hypothetical protein